MIKTFRIYLLAFFIISTTLILTDSVIAVQYNSLFIRPNNPVNPIGTWNGTGTYVKTTWFESDTNNSTDVINLAKITITEVVGKENVYEVSLQFVMSTGENHTYESMYGIFSDNKIFLNRSLVQKDEDGYSNSSHWGTLSFQNTGSTSEVHVLFNDSRTYMGYLSITGADAMIHSADCLKQ